MKLEILNKVPAQEEFFELYESTGWNNNGTYTADQLFRAINNSWYIVSVYDDHRLIGTARMISDGVYQTFICDVIVDPLYQGKRVGKQMIKRLLDECKENGIKWVQLSCAIGKKDFYEKLGFKSRPFDGPGMQLFL